MTSYLNFTKKTQITNVQMPEGETVEIKDASAADKGVIKLNADIGGDAAAPMVRRVNGNKLPQDSTLIPGQTLIAIDTHEWKYGKINLSDLTMFEEHTTSPDLLPKASTEVAGIINLKGDLSGTWENPIVKSINGANLPNTTNAHVNQIMTWDGSDYKLSNLDFNTYTIDGKISPNNLPNASLNDVGIIRLSGDLGGTYISPQVKKVNGISFPNDAPLNGNLLIANDANSFKYAAVDLANTNSISGILPSTNLPDATSENKGIVQLSGDLAGIAGSPVVAKLRGILVSNAQPTTNQVLTYSGGIWGPSNLPTYVPTDTSTSQKGVIQLSGDIGGSSTSVSVLKINGSSVPVSGSLTTGNVLQVSGTSSLSYAPINLAGGANYVSGALPNANQAPQNLGGDLSGTTSSANVLKIRNIGIASNAPTLNQVLQYDGSNWVPSTLSVYSPIDATTSAKGVVQLTNDLGGTSTAPTVVKLGSNVSLTGNFIPTNIINNNVSAVKGELIRIKTPVIDITGTGIKDTLIWTTPVRFKMMSCMIVFLSTISQAALQNVNLSVGTTSGGSNLLSYNLIGNETSSTTPLSTNPNNYFLTANGIFFRRGLGTVYTGTIEIVLHGFLY